MLTVLKLREMAAEEADNAREIMEKADSESRGLTQEEANDFDGHHKKAAEYEAQADRQERQEKLDTRLAKPVETKSTPEIATGERIEAPSGVKMYRYGELRAFKGPNAQVEAYRSGRFLAAVLYNHAKSRQWCHEHGVEIRVDNDTDQRAMGEGINTAGGFLVPDEFEQSIIDLREEYGSARQNCRIRPMASDHSNEPKKIGGLKAYPRGENKAAKESNQSWGNVELTAKCWDVLVRYSNELSEDTLISLAEDLAIDGALAFATSEDESCVDGDGTSTYHGIVGFRSLMIDGSHTGGYFEPTTCDAWSAITDAFLLQIMGKLPKYARRGAKWHCSPLAKVAVFDRLIMAAGGATMRERADGAYRPAYMGAPIEEWPAMPTVDAGAALNAKIMLVYGNMYMSSKLGIRKGITIKKLEERYAEFGQIGIMMTERFTINHHTITGKLSTDAGPLIGMLGNT